MFEKVNPAHPDKIADRIAGALVDLAYSKQRYCRIAAEVMIGHGKCHIITETSVHLEQEEVNAIVERIAGDYDVDYEEYPQDELLAENQRFGCRCGDNGIFKGVPMTDEQRRLSEIARSLYGTYQTDGKYILDDDRLIICQSNADRDAVEAVYPTAQVNPLGYWTGGPDVDTGATNRKLGSDMGDSITGGGLHGKDFSKADVSVNIFAWLWAQAHQCPVEFCCAIGDEYICGVPYEEIIDTAMKYIAHIGGFEKFAEWGFI